MRGEADVPDPGDEAGGSPAGTGNATENTAEPAATPRRTRRWFLVAAGTVGTAVLGGAGGVGAEFLRHRRAVPTPHPPPPLLLAARAQEAFLLRAASSAAASDASLASRLTQLRRDHTEHLRAIEARLAAYDPPTRRARRRADDSVPAAVPRDRAGLLAAEQDAARQTAARAEARAAVADEQLAAVLASIAACEATHAEVLR